MLLKLTDRSPFYWDCEVSGWVDGVQPEATPAHVSRKKIPEAEEAARLSAEDSNVM